MTDLTQKSPILGAPAWIPHDGRYLHNQRLGKIVDLNEDMLDKKFLFFLLNLDRVRAQIKGSATGATVKHTAPDRICAVLAPIPPISTQRRIAAILSAYDDLIENNTRRIAILEEMARRIYEEWFVRFHFPGHEKVRMVESELGLVPEGWETGTLSDILDNVRQATRPGEHLSSRRYVPIDCIAKRSLVLPETRPITEAQSSLVLFERDDILFGAMRPYFHKVAIAPCAGVTRTTCFVLRPRKLQLSAFATMAMFSDSVVAYASAHTQGATIPYAVWDGSLANYKVVIPPDSLVEMFEESVSPMLVWLRQAMFKQENLRTTRDLLLPKLISGELDVSHLPEPEAMAA
jgi:type I restriction enzyme S subunit